MRYSICFTVSLSLCLSTVADDALLIPSEAKTNTAEAGNSVSSANAQSIVTPTPTQQRRARYQKKLIESLDTIKPDSQLLLVWFTADDCPYCVKWMRGLKQDTSQGRFAKSDMAKTIEMAMVRKRSLRDPHSDQEFVPAIEFVKKARLTNGRIRDLGGYPWFTVYVDQQPVMESSQWDSDVLPALEKLAAKRLSLQ